MGLPGLWGLGGSVLYPSVLVRPGTSNGISRWQLIGVKNIDVAVFQRADWTDILSKRLRRCPLAFLVSDQSPFVEPVLETNRKESKMTARKVRQYTAVMLNVSFIVLIWATLLLGAMIVQSSASCMDVANAPHVTLTLHGTMCTRVIQGTEFSKALSELKDLAPK